MDFCIVLIGESSYMPDISTILKASTGVLPPEDIPTTKQDLTSDKQPMCRYTTSACEYDDRCCDRVYNQILCDHLQPQRKPRVREDTRGDTRPTLVASVAKALEDTGLWDMMGAWSSV